MRNSAKTTLQTLGGMVKDSAMSVLPICAFLLLLHFTIAKMPLGTLALFVVGAVLLVLGLGIFSMGAELSMMAMGKTIGTWLTKSRKLPLIIVVTLVLGVIITVAEPDLHVFAMQVPAVPNKVLVWSVGLGVGLYLTLAVLRILFKVKLRFVYLVMYIAVFVVAIFTAPDYLAVGFDAGGITTGPITVPFILALGTGFSAVRGGRSAEDDSFGLCSICSIGPILAVLIMGMFYPSSGMGFAFETASSADSVSHLLSLFLGGFLSFGGEVFSSLLPLTLVFLVLQLFFLKLPRTQLIRLGVGLVYAFIGLTIFLTGVNIGFMPAGTFLGETLASLSYNWVLIPIGVAIGCFVVAAEPAVHILNKQVEEITGGAISRRMMMIGLSGGVGIAIALAMLRILTGLSIWYFLLPGYVLALALSFFVPQIFTAIAFDSGGVSSGAMAAAFLLPFAVGVCNAVGGNPITDAFGIVAMVSMMPLISVQIMGLLYQIRLRRVETAEALDEENDEIVLVGKE